jgi:hypothetical protein
MSAFTPQERAIIDHTVNELREHGGRSVSEWSHQTSVGWQAMNLSEPIPYELALVSLEPLSEEELVALRKFDSAA